MPGIIVCASGAGSNLQTLLDEYIPVSAVVTSSIASGAATIAMAHEIPLHYASPKLFATEVDFAEHLIEIFNQYNPQYIVLAGWMHIMHKSVVDTYRNMMINLHPALPGAYPGLNAIERSWVDFNSAVLDTAGVMVHFVDEGIDTGHVLATQEIDLTTTQTREDYMNAIKEAEHKLLPIVVRNLLHAAPIG
jgi:phosphoribosylglycinamide formyltransferase 1